MLCGLHFFSDALNLRWYHWFLLRIWTYFWDLSLISILLFFGNLSLQTRLYKDSQLLEGLSFDFKEKIFNKVNSMGCQPTRTPVGSPLDDIYFVFSKKNWTTMSSRHVCKKNQFSQSRHHQYLHVYEKPECCLSNSFYYYALKF